MLQRAIAQILEKNMAEDDIIAFIHHLKNEFLYANKLLFDDSKLFPVRSRSANKNADTMEDEAENPSSYQQ